MSQRSNSTTEETHFKPLSIRSKGGEYDLVAIDLDGTLVDAQNNIPESAELALRELRAAGIKVVLVSGRPEIAILPVFRKLELTLPLISSGGAYVVDPANGTLIAEFQPPIEDIRALVLMARAAGLTLVFQKSNEICSEGSPAILEVLRAAVRVPIAQVEDGLAACPDPIKVTVCGPRPQLDLIYAEMQRLGLRLSAVLSGPEYLEVTAQGVSKGKALMRVAEYLHMSPERVLVIGDAPNDLSMFEVAGLAVAMGNAPPEVQAGADVVAPSLEQDGVAWALRNLVLKQ